MNGKYIDIGISLYVTLWMFPKQPMTIWME